MKYSHEFQLGKNSIAEKALLTFDLSIVKED